MPYTHSCCSEFPFPLHLVFDVALAPILFSTVHNDRPVILCHFVSSRQSTRYWSSLFPPSTRAKPASGILLLICRYSWKNIALWIRSTTNDNFDAHEICVLSNVLRIVFWESRCVLEPFSLVSMLTISYLLFADWQSTRSLHVPHLDGILFRLHRSHRMHL